MQRYAGGDEDVAAEVDGDGFGGVLLLLAGLGSLVLLGFELGLEEELLVDEDVERGVTRSPCTRTSCWITHLPARMMCLVPRMEARREILLPVSWWWLGWMG